MMMKLNKYKHFSFGQTKTKSYVTLKICMVISLSCQPKCIYQIKKRDFPHRTDDSTMHINVCFVFQNSSKHCAFAKFYKDFHFLMFQFGF